MARLQPHDQLGIMHGPAAACALAGLIVRGWANVLDLGRRVPDGFERPDSDRRPDTLVLR